MRVAQTKLVKNRLRMRGTDVSGGGNVCDIEISASRDNEIAIVSNLVEKFASYTFRSKINGDNSRREVVVADN